MEHEAELLKLAELLDVVSLTPEVPLASLQWDSMAMLSVIAWGRARGKVITGEMLKKMKTVADVLDAV